MWKSSSSQSTFQNVAVALQVKVLEFEVHFRPAAGFFEEKVHGPGHPDEEQLEQGQFVDEDPDDREDQQEVEEEEGLELEGVQLLHAHADVGDAHHDADPQVEAQGH